MHNTEYACKPQYKTLLFLCVFVVRSVAIGCPHVYALTAGTGLYHVKHKHMLNGNDIRHPGSLYLVRCTPRTKATPDVENQATSACVVHLIHFPALQCHMWTGGYTKLNAALKLISMNNGVSEVKCRVRSWSFSEFGLAAAFPTKSQHISSYFRLYFTLDGLPLGLA